MWYTYNICQTVGLIGFILFHCHNFKEPSIIQKCLLLLLHGEDIWPRLASHGLIITSQIVKGEDGHSASCDFSVEHWKNFCIPICFIYFNLLCYFSILYHFSLYFVHYHLSLIPSSTSTAPRTPQPPQCCPCLRVLSLFFLFLAWSLFLWHSRCQPALCLWICLYFACQSSLFMSLHIGVKPHGICLSLTGLSHSAQCLQSHPCCYKG